MFDVSVKLPVNREPWMISLKERENILRKAAKEGKKISVQLYHAPDTSTFRYRCYNIFKATMDSREWQTIYFFYNEIEAVYRILPYASLLILSRIKWTHELEKLAVQARKNRIPVIYDIDDYVCDVDMLKTVTNTLNVSFGNEEAYDFWFADISRLQQAAKLADAFITTNSFLGNKLSSKFNKPYFVIPNSLNREQLEVSEACFSRKQSKKTKKPYTIGYFSGTPSHINDFKVVSQELAQILNEHPDIVLKVVGFMEFPENMGSLIERGRIRFTPLVDFLELQMLMAQVDVSIVPLVNNQFTNCKSELKFFEAAVVGTPTIATPIFSYASAIKDGETGFLCNQGEWYDSILRLYSDECLSEGIAERARSYAISKYCGKVFLECVETAYRSCEKTI